MVDTAASLAAEMRALAARVEALQPPVVTPPAPAATQYFSPKSNWNTKIGATPQIVGGSAVQGWMQRLQATGLNLNNGSDWNVAVSIAPKGFSGPRVTAKNPDKWTMNNVPMLADAIGASDGYDKHQVIIDEDLNCVWNFQGNFRNLGTSYSAGAFGCFRLDGPGWYDPAQGGPWTGRSSNACLLGGLILPGELRAGTIPHALALGVDGILLADKPVEPAKTTDAGGVSGGLPNGSRLQLDPGFDISSLPGREARTIAKAMQDYGIFVVERSTGNALYFQSTSNGKASYTGMDFRGLTPALWSRCRVIAPATNPAGYDYPSVFSPAQPYKA